MPDLRDSDPDLEIGLEDQVQVSPDGGTVWVHSMDGTTVGRFSRLFGMDVHTTFTQQMAGAAQCLHCTHVPATEKDWNMFCELMHERHQIAVPKSLMLFAPA